MPVPPDPNAVIVASDGEIHDAHPEVHDDGRARVDIATEDDASALEAASADIVEAESASDDREEDLRLGRTAPAQQAAAAQSAAQVTATTTADPAARDDATLAPPRKPDDPQAIDDPVTPEKADEPLNPYLTDDKTDPAPDPVADDGTPGDDAAASE